MNISLPPSEQVVFTQKLLQWADRHYPFVAYFNGNNLPYPQSGFKTTFFAGTKSLPFEAFHQFAKKEMVGILAYELKDAFEKLQSNNPSILQQQETVFFLPEIKVEFGGDSISLKTDQPEQLLANIMEEEICLGKTQVNSIRQLTEKKDYLQTVRHIKNHIEEGDIYEMNYCMAFEAEVAEINPISLYFQLNHRSPMPFSAFFKAESQFLLCASPERFLKRSSDSIIAQPIKGTIKRGGSDEEDRQLMEMLYHSEKERAENLMIVDLMRNDLSKVSLTGSVQVDELFGIYTFRNLHQMISTVSSQLKPEIAFPQIIQSTFPMGSMTGAPKIKCMELIERYENFRRGWFSGSVGCINADGDFDFNVIIRSILYDAESQKIMFAVGSAITHDADPEQEYEECLLKASAIFDLLEGK